VVVRELTVELGSDEHGFAIEGPVPSLQSSPALPENTLIDWWPDRDPDLSGFVVKTGSQWGPFGVVMQVLDADPGPAPTRWQDVVELSVEITGDLYVGEIVNGPVGSVAAQPGSYRMRVAAEGRTESAARDASFPDDEDDDDTALEHYLVSIWPAPSSASAIVRQDSQYAQDELDPPAPEWPTERDPGLEAAWAIVDDLRGEPGANALPGDLGNLALEVKVPGLPTRVFNRVQYVFGWPPAQGGMVSPDPMATAYHDATLPEFDGPYEQVGHIRTTAVELDKPRQIVLRWNWVLDAPGTITSRPLLLAADSTVTITLQRLSAGDDPRTLVRLTQDGVPMVWVEHLEKLWAWHLVAMASR
jgi:hypothetical protein